MIAQPVSKLVRGIEYFSLADALKDFRRMVEKQTGSKIECVEVNAAEFLDDIAKHVGLAENKRREVLGDSAWKYILRECNAPIKVATKH